jgi:hypothetical protein
VAALLAIPAAGALQVLVRELWWATDPKTLPAPDPGPEPHESKEEGELFPVPPDKREHD